MAISFDTTRLNVVEVTLDMTADQREALLNTLPQLLTPKVVENLPPYFHGVNTKAAAQRWLSRMITESQLLIVKKRSESVIIGMLFIFVDEHKDAHIGYLVDEQYWRQGLASELLQGFMHHARQIGPWARLIGGVAADNTASATLLQKLGFIKASNCPPCDDVIFYEYRLAIQRS
ncbi:ferrichrome ABC transporter substrate-binding protein [Shewanella colwelliana]|uniref:Ferrichrome ABC transporter substrate-binding protein n=1 Tax=Shewanella colwelliana TaxID=23 RepID=A0ABQ4NTX8_SHECO|nr:GNAT family N-acetyltransferase [Shewanella colwelliana]GIU34538.1 ferrichrome ABC transporter substrate-binding protein [Shewanella colwelliana]